MDRETWWATVHGFTKNQTQLSIHMQCDYNTKILVFGHCHKIKKNVKSRLWELRSGVQMMLWICRRAISEKVPKSVA